jgi:hypothetical protein
VQDTEEVKERKEVEVGKLKTVFIHTFNVSIAD